MPSAPHLPATAPQSRRAHPLGFRSSARVSRSSSNPPRSCVRLAFGPPSGVNRPQRVPTLFLRAAFSAAMQMGPHRPNGQPSASAICSYVAPPDDRAPAPLAPPGSAAAAALHQLLKLALLQQLFRVAARMLQPVFHPLVSSEIDTSDCSSAASASTHPVPRSPQSGTDTSSPAPLRESLAAHGTAAEKHPAPGRRDARGFRQPQQRAEHHRLMFPHNLFEAEVGRQGGLDRTPPRKFHAAE